MYYHSLTFATTQSDKPENVFDYRLNELARDVVDIIDYYGKSYATVIGHDWGAGVAWWTAIMHPERGIRK